MARWFRLFEKKRGDRRTGSEKIAGIWEGAFFGILFVLGCLGLWVAFSWFVLPEWQVQRDFVPTPCRVLEVRLGTTVRDGQTVYRPEVCIEYRVADRRYCLWTYNIHTVRGNGYSVDKEHALGSLERFRVGETLTSWYDPQNPQIAVLERGIWWWAWLVLLIPLSFVILGAGGLSYQLWRWGKSAERLAVQGQPLTLTLIADPDAAMYPFVPEVPAGVSQPGTRLAYRLPVLGTPYRAIVAWLAAALAWNAAVLAFALGTYYSGHFDWSFSLFLLPCLLIGLTLLAAFFRQWMAASAVGETIVEISDFPLLCGQRYRVYLQQTGSLRLDWLEMLLVCEEEATFQHGTNTRRETRRVWQKTLWRHERFEVFRSVPFETETEIEIPAGMMHSFRSPHNEVRWRCYVRGSTPSWPTFERIFPLLVLPGPDRRGERRPSQQSVSAEVNPPEQAEPTPPPGDGNPAQNSEPSRLSIQAADLAQESIAKGEAAAPTVQHRASEERGGAGDVPGERSAGRNSQDNPSSDRQAVGPTTSVKRETPA